MSTFQTKEQKCIFFKTRKSRFRFSNKTAETNELNLNKNVNEVITVFEQLKKRTYAS
jgi:hypothetical protein